MELLIAFIGLVSGLITGFVGGRRASRLEFERETRLAIAQVARGIGTATHTMTWITWKATHQPHHLGTKDADAYDEDMHDLYPDLTGSLALVAALNREAYEKLKGVTKDVYALDGEIANATTALRDKAKKASRILASHHASAKLLVGQTNDRLAEIMAEVRRRSWGSRKLKAARAWFKPGQRKSISKTHR